MWLLLALCWLPAFAADDPLTREQRAALAEMEAKIVRLKAEGKLPETLASTSTATSTSKGTSSSLATVPKGCTRLETGASAVIDTSAADSPTGVSAHYGLSRPKEDSYLAEVNLEFARGAGFKDDLTPSALNQRYKDRVTGCLKQYEGFLKNERSGRSLVVRIAANPSIPVHQISVVADGKRANSVAYPGDINCPAILHEIMHVLGLADEYADQPALTEPLADCRPNGPIDSLMSDHEEAVNATLPGKSVEMCRCAVTGDACWKLAEKNKGDKCPPGTTSYLKDIPSDTKTSLNVFNTSFAFALNDKRIENKLVPAAHTSVLYPAHFRAITEPGCRDVNADYYGCVINSYRSSKADAGGCLPKPEACKWNSHKWLE